MAVTTTTGLDLNTHVIKSSDIDATVADDIKLSSGTLHAVSLSAATNGGTETGYIKITLTDKTIVVATDEPDIKFPLQEGGVISVDVTDASTSSTGGVAFDTLGVWQVSAAAKAGDTAIGDTITGWFTVK